MELPKELSALFEKKHFANYPFIDVPQEFFDDRGSIRNIADGKLGDVAVITSEPNIVRANHVHESDWHLSYLLYGSMTYSWKDLGESHRTHEILVSSNRLVYTPSKVPHMMQFLEKSCFIAISAMSRSQANYEADTTRLPEGYF